MAILLVFVAIMFLQPMLMICTSGTLAKFTDLKSTALRALWEKSALVTEREKSERERGKLRREREFWEKVPEDRVLGGRLACLGLSRVREAGVLDRKSVV